MSKTYEAIMAVVDQASGPILKIEENYRKLGETANAANKNMSPHQKLLHRFHEDFGKVHESFKPIGEHVSEFGSRMGDVLAPFGAIAGIGSIAGIVEMTHSFAEASEQLGIAAKIAGTTVQQFQVLSYAGLQTGVSMDGMQRSLGMLNKNLGLAAAGKNKDLVAIFNQLHISMRDSHGAMLSSTQDLPKLMDAFKNMKNPTEEAAIAQKLFGRAGLEMIPFLEKGSAGLKEYTAQFQKYGYVLTGADVAGGDKFNETWKNMQTAVSGFTMELGAKLAPVLTPMIQQFADWTTKNRDWISEDIAGAIKSIGDSLSHIDFKVVVHDVKDFGKELKTVVDHIGGFKTIAIVAGTAITLDFLAPMLAATAAAGGLALAIAGPLVASVGGVIVDLAKMAPFLVDITDMSEAFSALNIVMAANPLGAFVILVGLAAGAAYELYKHWDTVSKDLEAVWEVIDHDFHKVFDPMLNVIDDVANKAGSVLDVIGIGPKQNQSSAPAPGIGSLAKLGGGRFAAERGQYFNHTHTHVFSGLPPGVSVSTTSSSSGRGRVPNLGHSSMNGPR